MPANRIFPARSGRGSTNHGRWWIVKFSQWWKNLRLNFDKLVTYRKKSKLHKLLPNFQPANKDFPKTQGASLLAALPSTRIQCLQGFWSQMTGIDGSWHWGTCAEGSEGKVEIHVPALLQLIVLNLFLHSKIETIAVYYMFECVKNTILYTVYLNM